MPTHRTDPSSVAIPFVPAAALRALVDRRSAELNLTREKVAKAAQVGRSTLFGWLAGAGQPSAVGWHQLAVALQMSVGDMFDAMGKPLKNPVERARLDRGWTRAVLAETAQVSFATVRSIEAGGQVRADAAARIAGALGLPSSFVQQVTRVTTPAATPIGQVLEQRRLELGWTIAQLARHLGAARQLVSAWLSGAEPVATRWVPLLAEFTGRDEQEVAQLIHASRPDRAVNGSRFSLQIRAGREVAGLSQGHLAERLGVSVAAVEQWESGRRAPNLEMRARLNEVLGASCEPIDGPDRRDRD